MNTEDAIKNLTAYMYYALDDIPKQAGEAMSDAISALREQQERQKGCEYCTNPEEVTGTEPPSAGPHEYFKLKSGFRLERHYGREWVLRCESCDAVLLTVTHCPHCGHRLKEA